MNDRGSGSAQYHPQMMLALLVYCYADGLFSSRRIEQATYRDVGVRYVAANRHPDHDTICKFRRDNEAAVREAFLQVLLLAREVGLLRIGLVSVDGTQVDANASRHRSVRYDRAGELIEQLLERAEAADLEAAGEDERLPAELKRRKVLVARLEVAWARLQAKAKARAEIEWQLAALAQLPANTPIARHGTGVEREKTIAHPGPVISKPSPPAIPRRGSTNSCPGPTVLLLPDPIAPHRRLRPLRGSLYAVQPLVSTITAAGPRQRLRLDVNVVRPYRFYGVGGRSL